MPNGQAYSKQAYLAFLTELLSLQQLQGNIDKKAVKDLLERANALLDQGWFGPGLPAWNEYLSVVSGQTKLENLLAPEVATGMTPAEQAQHERWQYEQSHLTPWQKTQQERWMIEAGAGAGLQERQMALQEKELAWRMRQPTGAGAPSRSELYDMFELWRRGQASGLEGPTNWIKRWFAENMPNPYERSMFPEKYKAEDTGPAYAYAHQISPEQEGAGWKAFPPGVKAVAIPHGEFMADPERYEKEYGTQIAPRSKGMLDTEIVMGEGGPILRKATWKPDDGGEKPKEMGTPPTPGWLRQFVPGMGQTLEKKPLGTPGYQEWMKTPELTKQRLGAYGEWAGYSLEDMFQRMIGMMPQTPSGVAGRRWIPMRQR